VLAPAVRRLDQTPGAAAAPGYALRIEGDLVQIVEFK
jgi:hypothetical protein